MSVREFLAGHAAASRAALASAVLFAFGSVLGCGSTVSDENIGSGHCPSRQESGHDRRGARDQTSRMKINRLKQQQDALEGKRSDCLKLAASYRAKSAGVWSDPSVGEGQRPVLADQYNSLADENEEQAYRYGQIAGACDSRISLLVSRRHDQLRQAEDYESLTVPLPESE